MECAQHLEFILHSADSGQFFGFFLLYAILSRFEIAVLSNRRRQNRYLPVTWQFWQIIGQSLTSPVGPWGHTDRPVSHYSFFLPRDRGSLQR